MLGCALLALVPAFPQPRAPSDVCVIRRASLDAGGAQASGHTRKPSISADGAWVAFESEAPDLVPNDLNGASDVFVKHVPSGALERVSISTGGAQGDAPSTHATLSADARYVVFESEATNLVSGDSNGVRDVFVRDRMLGTTRRVSVTTGGTQGNAVSGADGLWRGSTISGDGALVAFSSGASNLVTGDTNNSSDVFLHVLSTSTTTRGSYRPTPNGPIQGNSASQDPALSYDGQFLAYVSSSSNLVDGDTNAHFDVFVLDRLANGLVRASVDSLGTQADSASFQPALPYDGKRVAFESFATNLVPNDTNAQVDVFVHNLVSGSTERASVAWDGSQGTSYAYTSSISASGDRVAFTSASPNLVPGGSGIATVYVRDFVTQTTERWGVDANDSPGFAGSNESALSADGYTMVFASLAALVSGDTNGAIDAYHRRCGPTGVAYCAGTALGCPCGNAGAWPAGCANSASAAGALLDAQGMPRVTLDSVTLHVQGMPASAPILFFQGTSEPGGGSGLPFGDGLRCAGGGVVRLGTRAASGGTASFGFGIGADPAISVKGGVPAGGAVLRYQGWYRDTAPFCMPEGFNFTNGMRIEWAP